MRTKTVRAGRKTAMIMLTAAAAAMMPITAMADTADDDRVKSECMQMLNDFIPYMNSIYTPAADNSEGTKTGYFKAKSAGKSNEDGVRTNADMAMICAFLHKYQNANSNSQIENSNSQFSILNSQLPFMALKALRYAYSTHKANKLLPCTDKKYWGMSWESSLWTESVALAAFFLDDQLTDNDRKHIFKMLEAEADYDLKREVPTGFAGDTKAEENGWETNVLAAACTMMPQHERAQQWYDKMRLFAFNCLTLASDSTDNTLIDGIPAKNWYKGQNLYDDYTLQNHNFFHTNYQSVVIQELAETILILRLIGNKKTVSETLLWHQKEMFDSVLKHFALPDGELAMPNGSDWSMLTYDQMPSFAAIAALYKDPEALMMELKALESIRKRQLTTKDGAWMLKPDIGPRRMGVTAHRVMMTYLIHDIIGTSNVKPATWQEFCKRHKGTHVFDTQKIVQMLTENYHLSFSQCDGLKSTGGILYPFIEGNDNLLLPCRKNGAGTLTGFINDKKMKVEKEMAVDNDKITVTLRAEDDSYRQTIEITPNKRKGITIAVTVEALQDLTIESDKTAMLAVSLDPLTKTSRTINYKKGKTIITKDFMAKKDSTITIKSPWICIDNQFKITNLKNSKTSEIVIADPQNINSIDAIMLYPFAGNNGKILKKGEKIKSACTMAAEPQ